MDVFIIIFKIRVYLKELEERERERESQRESKRERERKKREGQKESFDKLCNLTRRWSIAAELKKLRE